MAQMLKREFYLNRVYFLLVFLTFPIIHGVVYPLLVFISILGFAMYHSFYGDFKNHTNRFFVSMPVQRKYIVLSRYSFLIFTIMLSLFYLWLIDYLGQYGLPPLDFGKLTGLSIFFMAIILSLFLSIFIPFFYFYQSFQKVFIMHFLLMSICFIGFIFIVTSPDFPNLPFVRIIADIITFQPILVPVLFALSCLYLSYQLSIYFFNKKDIS